jgi:translation initiation factor 5A
MSSHIEVFEKAESGASAVFPMAAGQLRKGGMIVIKGCPCKVVDISVSKTGKHGHAKAHIVATDIFTDKKLEELCPTSHNVEVPVVKRSDLTVVDINEDGFLSLMDDDGTTREDLRLPEGDLGKEIQAKFEEGAEIIVNVVAAMGIEQVLGWKTGIEQ